MRLSACLGIVLLATGACAHIPEVIRFEVDGSTVEIKKRPEPPVQGEEATAGEVGEQPEDDGRE